MGISYDLDMATEQTASQVAHELCDIARTAGLFDDPVTPELVLDDGTLTMTHAPLPRPTTEGQAPSCTGRTGRVHHAADRFTSAQTALVYASRTM